MLKLVLLALIGLTSAQQLTVCRNGRSLTIQAPELSPYDELGGCRISDYFTTPPTTAPSAKSDLATAPSPKSDSAPTSKPTPTEKPIKSPNADKASAPASNPTKAKKAASDPANGGTTKGSKAKATSDSQEGRNRNGDEPDDPISDMAGLLSSETALNDSTSMPQYATFDNPDEIKTTMAPQNDQQNRTGEGDHGAHEDSHEWQATGTFNTGHMQAVVKMKKEALPANLDANDPKNRVLVFLQWFSPQSVFENPQLVFMFFQKPQGQRAMRIN